MVIERKGPVTYKIELPPSMRRAHNVFHVSELKQYHCPVDHEGPLSVVVDADGTEKKVVTGILDKKRDHRKVYYVVQFDG